MSDLVELLFFDTFAHENSEELNLDLVQFPKPVYVTEVRIIPLGARVQADFPGGVRLGATNPSQFQIEFFVNDLGKPGASTFETLGGFEYNQNGCINLVCVPNDTIRKIPTDGLVLRGLYTTITLAVYGTLTANITEQIIPAVVTPSIPIQPNSISEVQQIISQNPIENEWQEPLQPVAMEYAQQPTTQYPQQYVQPETYSQEYGEYYNEVPKDPRSYHHTPEPEWDAKNRGRSSMDRDNRRDTSFAKKTDTDGDRRERDRRYSRSRSRDRTAHDYRESSRDKEHDRDWDRDYRDHDKDWDRDRERDGRDRYKHSDNYSRRYSDREERKRPRTPPPMASPKRPHTPHSDHKDSPPPKEPEFLSEEEDKQKLDSKSDQDKIPLTEESNTMDVEEFEPILSDEDILDDSENFQDVDYDYSNYTNNDDIIKLFIPGSTPIQKYQQQPLYTIKDNKLQTGDTLKNLIAIADDFFKSSITRYTLKEFERHNAQIKEEFIHLSEKVTLILGDEFNFRTIVEIYTNHKGTKDDTIAQTEFITETLLNWLTIALDFDMANAQEQPPYKIRHIKCGVKLAEYCSSSKHFIKLLSDRDFRIHDALISLYDREYMALSIKLMILKALDAYLLNKNAIEMFLVGSMDNKENGFHNLTPLTQQNGYRALVGMLAKNPSVRLKFGLNSILKKLNLFEGLHRVWMAVLKHRKDDYEAASDDIEMIGDMLQYVVRVCQTGSFAVSQPKRFLPVVAQFDINRSESVNVLVELLKMQNLLEVALILLTNRSTMQLPSIRTPVYEVLNELGNSLEGLRYLADNACVVNAILKVLLQGDEEVVALESPDIKSHNLGLSLAYKLQVLYHVEFLFEMGKQPNVDFDNFEVIDQLHALFCLTFSTTGRGSVSQVIGMGNNINSILQIIDLHTTKIDKIRKSPAIGYVVDLIYYTIMQSSNIPLLETYSKQLLEIISQQELFDPITAMRLVDLGVYLKPYECYSGSYDVATLVEVINKNLHGVTTFSGTLITCLRILQHIGISPHVKNSEIFQDNPLHNFNELKYKHVILQLFPLDGVGLLCKILTELCEYYEQPRLHTSTFVSSVGILIINLIEPCVLLVKQMLTFAIQCRNTKFKDLTAVQPLLQTYNLCQSFPIGALGYFRSRNICRQIVDALLVFTQPISEEIHEKDSLNKTLWTLMCGEVIRYTISAPYTFIAGLSVFSELLPLPLPIQTKSGLGEEELSWAVNLRKLWSAHLHSHSSYIQELVSKLCTTTYQPLLNLLRKVCAQISDLAANSAKMIARGMLDNVHGAIVISDDVKKLVCNGYISRLMNFLACLVTHSSLKCAFLQLLSNASGGKGDEKYPAIIQAFAQILRSTSNVTSHVQTQECILSILQSFSDTEITLYQNAPGITPSVYLANALPSREHMLVFLNTMLDHIMADNSFLTYLPVVRTLLLLTEHDYGFYHLSECLLKRNGPFNVLLTKLDQKFSKDNTECLRTLNTFIEFLRVCSEPEEVETELAFEPRKMKMSVGEVQALAGWRGKDGSDSILVKVEDKLKEVVLEDPTFEGLLESLQSILKLLKSEDGKEEKDEYLEPLLPPPETLLVQFSGRPMFTTNETADERLTSSCWLMSMGDDNEAENVTCDLFEICRQELSPDVNLIKQVERLCRICLSESTEQIEKEKRLSTQKDKMRRPFVTPVRGRGFMRTIQVRSDLFRSRPPNTSRPPSLHVDDFVALETCGAQPTGPTGYNKISREMLATSRVTRGTRGRAFVASERAAQYRQMSWWGPGAGRAPY